MRRVLGIVAISIAGLTACNPFAPDQSVVLEVDGLSTSPFIEPGSPLTIYLSLTTGGCTIFDHIAVVRVTSGAVFAAIGRNTAKGKTNYSCPAVIRPEQHSYTLNPPFQSPFEIRVNRGSLPPLTATVQVH